MRDYRQLAVACHFGSASKTDIEEFITSTVEACDDYSNQLFDAYSNNLEIARSKMLAFIAVSFPDFDVLSGEGLEFCRAELKRQIELLLEQKITAFDFCKFFNSMEINLVVDSSFSPDELAFLGDLYNACDWSEESWTLDNTPYLAKEAASVIANIGWSEQGSASNADR